MDDLRVNLDDIARLTDAQLAAVVRLRDVRPRKVAVSVRLDARVLAWLRSKGEGHLTRINDILTNLMEAEQRTRGQRAENQFPPATTSFTPLPLISSSLKYPAAALSRTASFLSSSSGTISGCKLGSFHSASE